MNKLFIASMGLAALAFASCKDNDTDPDNAGATTSETTWPKDSLAVFADAEWLPGGEKGTTSNEQGCYSNQSPQIDNQGLYTTFKHGENFFEHDANYFTHQALLGIRSRLGALRL